ncbi:motility-associated protein [Vibrio breoganii]
MQKLLGFSLAFIAIFGAFSASGGTFAFIFKPLEIFIIFGAAAGALIASSTASTLSLMWFQIKQSFGKTKYDRTFYEGLLCLMYELLDVAKKKGTAQLDRHVEKPDESAIFQKYSMILQDRMVLKFLVDAFRLSLVSGDGAVKANLENELEEEIEVLRAEYLKPYQKLYQVGEATPALGILACVLGMVIVMQDLGQEITIIGQGIAAAMTGTFYGVFANYILIAPLALSIKDVAGKQLAPLYCIKSVISSYLLGQSQIQICVNAGRKHIETRYKPSFTSLEHTITRLNDGG